MLCGSASYDYNGNMTSGVGATFTFDVANRILSAAEISGGVEYYGYGPDNRRIYKKLTSGAEEYTFYGGQGERLGVYNLTGSTMSAMRTDVWFAGKLISENSNAVFPDQVGTNRAGGARFRPYGDEITSTANDREKFATYTRDSYTGVDYAEQRYYASSYGRFNTSDPSRKSMRPKMPLSWNRYSYVTGDPINHFDRHGTEEDCDPDDPDCCDPDEEECCDPCDPGCGALPDGLGATPACSGGDPVGGDPPPPVCDEQLHTRPTGGVAGLIGSHSYVELTDSNGNEWTVEGYRDATATTFGSWGALEDKVTENGFAYHNDNPTKDLLFGGDLIVPCSSVQSYLAVAAGFNTTAYYPLGPNSNSFLSWFLDGTGLRFYYPTAPPGAIGWGVPIPGN
jgi:RHS repeat-associated protein